MKYHFYFHNDMDGISSTAILLNFFRLHGDGAASLNPIDYTPGLKEKWPSMEFKQPSIVVDFLYHPSFTWWFDHHLTSFVTDDWRNEYKNDKTHYFDPNHKSCAAAVLYHLQNQHNYQPPESIRELEVGATLIDSAGYKSPAEAIDFNNPAIALGLLLREHKTSDPVLLAKFYADLADVLSKESIRHVVKMPEYQQEILKIKTKLELTLKEFDKFCETRGNTVFLNLTQVDSAISHMTAYYMRPQTKYSVRFSFDPETGIYYLGVGSNKWYIPKAKINIGQLLSKYGGGGHETVGGYESKSREHILKVVEEVIEYLNKHD